MAESNEVLLRVDNLEVVYQQVITAIRGVSFHVNRGAIVALIGTNGAGKTTTLRAISGFIGLDDARCAEGTIRFRGAAIQNQPPHRAARRGIVLVPERDKVFESLTVQENLEVSVSRRAGNAIPKNRALEFFPALQRLRGRQAGYLSGGERQMLTLAAALACGPELLLVDELSLGLAPLVVQELLATLRLIRRELGITMVLVEQNAKAALSVADYAYVIENGRVVLDGNPERLAGHPDVQEFYLGQGERQTRRSYRDVKQYRRSRRWYG